MSRMQPRRNNGRYERATLANTFGLGNEVCDKCGQCHPYKKGTESPPIKCAGCGIVLPYVRRTFVLEER
jgi:hypothetical protein